MKETKFLDEKFANARRMYLEDRINRDPQMGVWKGRIYHMIPYTIVGTNFAMAVPDFLLEGEKEEQLASSRMDRPFCVLLSPERDVSCTFYKVPEQKIYEASEVQELFGRLFPGSRPTSVKIDTGELGLCGFCYGSKKKSFQLYHTIFMFHSEKQQIFGHLNGEAGEQEGLAHILEKMLITIEGRNTYEGGSN